MKNHASLNAASLAKIMDKSLPKSMHGQYHIICHPSLFEKLKALAEPYTKPKDVPSDVVMFIHEPVKIMTNDKIEAQQWTGRWLRTKLCNDRFTDWVEDHEVQNPQSWQIYFGFVEKEMEDVFYVIQPSLFRVFDPGYEMNIDFKRRSAILASFA